MANIKIEAKAYKNTLRISALTEKKEIVIEDGYRWLRKTPVIESLGTFQHDEENGITKVKVISDLKNGFDAMLYPHLPEKPE